MRLLTVYARMDSIPSVVRALLAAGAPSMTITHVDGAGYDNMPERYTAAPGVQRKAPEVAKVEIVCATAEVDYLLRALAQAAVSVSRRDRVVPVRQVEPAVSIRRWTDVVVPAASRSRSLT